MKIYKKTIFTIILFLICMTNTYAACTQEEINEFKKIEDEYTIKYEFNKDTKDYTLTFNAPMMDKYNYFTPFDFDEVEILDFTETGYTFSKVKPGEYKIDIMLSKETCDMPLKTITLKLKGYNSYSEDPLCEGIEEFVLCQETYDKEIDYETFKSRVNTYKKSKEKKTEQNLTNEKEENIILKYFKENILEIIIIVIFVILVLITTILTIKSIRKSRRLE